MLKYCILHLEDKDLPSKQETHAGNTLLGATQDTKAAIDAAKQIAATKGQPVLISQVWSNNEFSQTRVLETGRCEKVMTGSLWRHQMTDEMGEGFDNFADNAEVHRLLYERCLDDHRKHLEYLKTSPESLESEMYRYVVMEEMVSLLEADVESFDYGQSTILDECTALCIIAQATESRSCLDFLYECWASTDLGIRDAIEECMLGLHYAFNEERSHPVAEHTGLDDLIQDANKRTEPTQITKNASEREV